MAALVSGGVESAALIEGLVRRGTPVQPLYVRQGYRWEPVELQGLRRLLRYWAEPQVRALVVLRAPASRGAGAAWARGRGRVPGARSADLAMELPDRNLALLTVAGLWCARHRVTTIAHGTLATNPFPDATAPFFRALGAALTQALGCPVRITAPLRRLTKRQVLQRLPVCLAAATWSCVHPVRGRHCGRCNKCAERRRAFRAADLFDPTPYAR